MFRALWTSASGMTTQQTNLDVILNNGKKANH
jgi:flagellar basal body rod protein FlgG